MADGYARLDSRTKDEAHSLHSGDPSRVTLQMLPDRILERICRLACLAHPYSALALLRTSKQLKRCALPYRYTSIALFGPRSIRAFLEHIDRTHWPTVAPPISHLVFSDRPLRDTLHPAPPDYTAPPPKWRHHALPLLLHNLLLLCTRTLTELRCVFLEEWLPEEMAHVFREDAAFPHLRTAGIYVAYPSQGLSRLLLPTLPALENLHLVGRAFDLADIAAKAPALRTVKLSDGLSGTGALDMARQLLRLDGGTASVPSGLETLEVRFDPGSAYRRESAGELQTQASNRETDLYTPSIITIEPVKGIDEVVQEILHYRIDPTTVVRADPDSKEPQYETLHQYYFYPPLV